MNNSVPAFVLDSYAVLAYLQREQGGAVVTDLLEAANRGQVTLAMCLVNFGEVLYIVERHHGLRSVHSVLGALELLPITIVPADQPLTLAAAHIKANHAMSYADAFAAALAQRNGAVIVTGDPEFHAVQDMIQIKWL
jgi:predicted nucleic acid-binding protein